MEKSEIIQVVGSVVSSFSPERKKDIKIRHLMFFPLVRLKGIIFYQGGFENTVLFFIITVWGISINW